MLPAMLPLKNFHMARFQPEAEAWPCFSSKARSMHFESKMNTKLLGGVGSLKIIPNYREINRLKKEFMITY